MSKDIAISVQNLTKIYKLYDTPMDRLKESLHPFRRKYHKDFFALNDVSFEIRKGESVGIIGKNGSGKSTLLKILSGVLSPTSGNIQVNGKVSALLELGAGFNPELTGIENVYFNGTLMGYTREQMDERLDDILAFADIGEFVHQPVKMYSSGMFVRLAFAVAINVEPDILIVDEALSVGDIYFQAKCMTAIDRFKFNGTTILLVTHDLNTVKTNCGTALFIDGGRLEENGFAADIVDCYEKRMRLDINKSIIDSNTQLEVAISRLDVTSYNELLTCYIDDKEFTSRADLFRYGTGEVRLTNVQLFDDQNNELSSANFDQQVNIRLHAKFEKETVCSFAYHIRNKNNLSVLASNTLLETGTLIEGKPGDKVVIDFATKLPLASGTYSILAQVVKPVVQGHVSEFIDVVENTVCFRVADRSPSKIWSAVYVENKVTIWR